jgi:hypothetical protein
METANAINPRIWEYVRENWNCPEQPGHIQGDPALNLFLSIAVPHTGHLGVRIGSRMDLCTPIPPGH